jgi:hypothetical protein
MPVRARGKHKPLGRQASRLQTRGRGQGEIRSSDKGADCWCCRPAPPFRPGFVSF